MLCEAEADSLSMFESLLLAVSGSKTESKPLVSRLIRSKRIACEGEKLYTSEVENLDSTMEELKRDKSSKTNDFPRNLQKQLETFEMRVQDLDEGIENPFRHLMRIRVSILKQTSVYPSITIHNFLQNTFFTVHNIVSEELNLKSKPKRPKVKGPSPKHTISSQASPDTSPISTGAQVQAIEPQPFPLYDRRGNQSLRFASDFSLSSAFFIIVLRSPFVFEFTVVQLTFSSSSIRHLLRSIISFTSQLTANSPVSFDFIATTVQSSPSRSIRLFICIFFFDSLISALSPSPPFEVQSSPSMLRFFRLRLPSIRSPS
ncbi:Protein BPS1, chloroplastic [Dillenia turbinata]|uniref:Protein BPS1, chloroplastic n=1 Tax=Dillenia turbinata TaxID=194707 RepID=A0AAN8ZIK3_9MAGN